MFPSVRQATDEIFATRIRINYDLTQDKFVMQLEHLEHNSQLCVSVVIPEKVAEDIAAASNALRIARGK